MMSREDRYTSKRDFKFFLSEPGHPHISKDRYSYYCYKEPQGVRAGTLRLPSSVVRGPGQQQGAATRGRRARWCIARCDCDPSTTNPNSQNSEEFLSFSSGDLIKIIGDIEDDGSYWCEIKGKKGFVPNDMMGPRKEQPPDEKDKFPAEAKKMVALFDYDPSELSPNVDPEEELSFKRGNTIYVFGDMDEDGFFLGEVNGVRGLVPCNFLAYATDDYVERESSGRGGRGHGQRSRRPPSRNDPSHNRRKAAKKSLQPVQNQPATDSTGMPPPDMLDINGKGRCYVYTCINSYKPIQHNGPKAKLSVKAGDNLLVWGGIDQDGFYFAETLDERRGLVPGKNMKKLVGEDLAQFHHSLLMHQFRDSDESDSTNTPQDQDVSAHNPEFLGEGVDRGADSEAHDFVEVKAEMLLEKDGDDDVPDGPGEGVDREADSEAHDFVEVEAEMLLENDGDGYVPDSPERQPMMLP